MKLPHRRQFLYLTAGAAALPAASCIARAQAYPARPIRLVIPFPPGGAYDAVGRPWADRVKPLLGTVVVENIGGGGSSLGAAAVARARPDGYTILLGGTQTHVNEASAQEPTALRPNQGLGSDCGRGRQCSLHRRPSGSAGSDGRGANRLREGKSRQAVLRALWDRFYPASDRRTFQIASGYP